MLSSVKFRLIAWFLSVFFVVMTGLGFFLYYELEYIVIGSVDTHLHSKVQLIAGLMDVDEGILDIELSEVEAGDYALPLSGHYYQIVSRDGRVIARSPSLGSVDATLPIAVESDEPTTSTIIGPGNSPLRLLNETFHLDGGVTVTVQASKSLEDSYELLALFRGAILLVFPSVFVLSGLGMLIITGHSLRPLKIFSKKIETITEKNLNERIDEGTVAELRPLAAGFNTMLSRLEESFARQKRFFSDASHELRTPATVIKSTCDVMLRRKRTAGEYEGAIRKIGETARRLTELVNRILEVSELDSGRASFLLLADLDLKDILARVLILLEPSASGREVKIYMKDRHVRIRGDREKLLEAFTNIVDNAIKYNKRGGTVDIDMNDADGYGVVSVSDTGVGIAEADIGSIFERFYRVDTSRAGVAGSGLGLSIVKGVVEAHGGRVEVSSKVGDGTTFTVFLPQGRATAGSL